jgi:hypothetical protein
MSVLVIDAGNSIIKAKISRREKGEIDFLHALRQLRKTLERTILNWAILTSEQIASIKLFSRSLPKPPLT